MNSLKIFEALENVKNEIYVMPAFQRQYVWTMEQIEKLWDSILLGYPISTFLFWKLSKENMSDDTYFCRFRKSCEFRAKGSAATDYELSKINLDVSNIAVLDGQQRLTSLFLSLYCDDVLVLKAHERSGTGGTRAKLLIELDESKIEIDGNDYNSKKYDIRFTEKIMRISPTQFEFRKLIENPAFRNENTRKDAIEGAIKSVHAESKNYARTVLETLCKKVFDEPLINYMEIDGNQDDALEMFVRFNSGGKPLSKSQITMSILGAYWNDSKQFFGKVLSGSFCNFGEDFIIRTALMLYGDVVKSNINEKTARELRGNWDYFKQTLTELDDLLKSMNIETARFAKGWNVLLPVIFFIYNNPDFKEDKDAIRAYLVRAALFTFFKSGTTGKLSVIRNQIIDNNNRITIPLLDSMNELRVTEAKIEDLLDLEYGSKVVSEILYYLSLDWHEPGVSYDIDHLHPSDAFSSKPLAVKSMEEWQKCRMNRNRLPNLELLEESWNRARHERPLQDFYDDFDDTLKKQFRAHALLPENVSLKIEDFATFFEERRKLLAKKIKEILL